MSDLRKLLDDLDAARERSTTDVPWRQDSGYGEDILTADGDQFGATGEPADAALIVAAVNALPKLTAALRAVLDLAEAYDRTPDIAGSIPEDIRYVITAALDPAPPVEEVRGDE